MSEEPHIPAEKVASPHTTGHKIGAVVAPALLMVANNMPGVGYNTETVDRLVTEHHQVIDEEVVTLPANPADTKITIRTDVDNEHRVDFQTTESDAESSEDQVATQLEAALDEDDWARVYDISVTGMASAEDEQPGGGLQEQSDANTNLALQRALLASKPVLDAFAAKGIDARQPVEKVDGQPAEPMLQFAGVEDTWSDNDLTKATEFAEQFGYDSAEAMVEHYNDGGTPPAVNEFLKPLLDDQRGAEITLKLRDANGGEGEQIIVTRVRDVVSVKRVSQEMKQRDIVNNQVAGNIPEHEDMPKPTDTPTDDPEFKPPVVAVVEPPAPPEGEGSTVTVVGPPPPLPPRPRLSRDWMYRQKQRAPQGNGQRPIVHRGRVHQSNPNPRNF